MKYFLIALGVLTIIPYARAQEFVDLDQRHPPTTFDQLHDPPVISNAYLEIHLIWAAPGFKGEENVKMLVTQRKPDA